MLSDQADLYVGASTGAAVAACLRRLNESARPLRALCLIADGGENYGSTVYDDDWLYEHRINLPASEYTGAEFERVGTIESRFS